MGARISAEMFSFSDVLCILIQITLDRLIMMFSGNSNCLYTGVFGGYEKLNELVGAAKDSKIKKICFTDDENLTSETWEIRIVKPEFPLDSVRSQRMIKINPHKFLPKFKSSVYIDNTVQLTVDPLQLIELNCKSSNVSFPMHSFRNSVYEEFFAVIDSGLDDSARIYEQLNHYQIICPVALHRKPYWAGIIIRNHLERSVIHLMETWYNQILRYSRRDQLSLVYSELMTGTKINKLTFDNMQSEYHIWPIESSRHASKRSWSPSLSGGMPIFEKIKKIKSLESDLDNKINNLLMMNDDVIKNYKPQKLPDGFDPQLYLSLHKDVAESGVDPEKHYLEHGWKEGRRWR
ncbi:DUF616 domain-containing protein [Pantoea sp. EABMAA-21]|uniref:glycosyltransferase domain-containing protein n=1 Tax=Pantoea sp. EABMAA-21 TaxID=3043302 RepID=UPI0024B59571|nr:glycosyltransferase domain-containing protein [Pantoea sp. EABMAA-21]MDI9276153.1 DUF616 domain-containing protein [Pantoea sp. EABMAA-21]